MRPTRIREDSHGLYVRCGGVCRPHRSLETDSQSDGHRNVVLDGKSRWQRGMTINVGPVPYAPFCRLEDGQGNIELWHYHDDGVGKHSHECWKPAADPKHIAEIVEPLIKGLRKIVRR